MLPKRLISLCMLLSLIPFCLHAMRTTDGKRKLEDDGSSPSKHKKIEYASLHDAVRSNDVHGIQQYLNQFRNEVGSRVQKRDDKGRTALYIAASRGLEGVANTLCNHGACPYTRCSRRKVSPFEAAAIHGHVHIMQLFRNHAKVNQNRITDLTNNNFSIFHRIAAARIDHVSKKKAFDFLQNHKIELSVRLPDHHAPYLAAVWVGDSKTAKLLSGKGDVDDMCYATWRQNALESVRSDAASSSNEGKFLEMLSICGDPFILDEVMRNPQEVLTSPSKDGCWLQLKQLWQDTLAEVNEELYSRLFTTKWHSTYAAKHLIVKELERLAQIKDESRIAQLIKLGVDINTQDEISGGTALHRVCTVESAALLCKFGALRDVEDANKQKPSIVTSLQEHEALQQSQDTSTKELDSRDEDNTEMQQQAEDEGDEQKEKDAQEKQLEKSHKDAKSRRYSVCALL